MSSYEEIKSLYPAWLTEIREFDILFQIFGEQIDEINAYIEQKQNDVFITDKISDKSLSELESFMKLDKSELSKSERRYNVLSRFKPYGKIGYDDILDIVQKFITSPIDISLDNATKTLMISLTKSSTDNFYQKDIVNALRPFLKSYITLNLIINVAIDAALESKCGMYVHTITNLCIEQNSGVDINYPFVLKTIDDELCVLTDSSKVTATFDSGKIIVDVPDDVKLISENGYVYSETEE